MAGAEAWSHCIHGQEASVQLDFTFYLVQDPRPSSMNPVSISHHRYGQRLVSWVILNSIKLILTITKAPPPPSGVGPEGR